MKKYIKPITEFTVMPELEMIMISGVDPYDTVIIPGGGSASGGNVVDGGVKGRGGRHAQDEEEDDPILHLIIDQEMGNTSDLW